MVILKCCKIILWCLLYSVFVRNFGGNGGIIDFSFFSGKFENVSFIGNIGPAVRVSLLHCMCVGGCVCGWVGTR